MKLPFTVEQFLQVFTAFNTAIWPCQIAAYILGVVAIGASFSRSRTAQRIVCAILAAFWLFMGLFYHLVYFAPINKAAYLFGAAFVLQGALFAVTGTVRRKLFFLPRPDAYGIVGFLLILYAMLLYPLFGYAQGHVYPSSPVFGVAPCPTTIFTFGLMLLARPPVPIHLLAIPFLWSIVGFTAALKLGIREDIGLLVAGFCGSMLVVLRNRRWRAGGR